MPTARWLDPISTSAFGYEPEPERGGLLGFLGAGPDLGAEVGDRAGVISQILMNLGAGQGGRGIAEATAAASERSEARKDRRQLTNTANRLADKLELSNPELADVLRSNPAFGMKLLGQKYEQEWANAGQLEQLEKQYSLAGKNAQALEAQKQAAIDRKRELAAKAWGINLNDSSAAAAPEAALTPTTETATAAATVALAPSLGPSLEGEPAPSTPPSIASTPTPVVAPAPAPAVAQQVSFKPPPKAKSPIAAVRNAQERIGSRLGFDITIDEAQRYLSVMGDDEEVNKVTDDVTVRHNKEMEPYVRRQQFESSLDIEQPSTALPGPMPFEGTPTPALDPRTAAVLKRGGITQPYSVPDPVQAAAQLETGFMSGDAGMAQATGDVGAIQAKALEEKTKQQQFDQGRREIAAVVNPILADPMTPFADKDTLRSMLVGDPKDLPTHMGNLSKITQDRLKLAQDEAQFQQQEKRLVRSDENTEIERAYQRGITSRKTKIDERASDIAYSEHKAKTEKAELEAAELKTKKEQWEGARDVTLKKSLGNIANLVNVMAEAGPLSPTTGVKGYAASFLGGDTAAGRVNAILTSITSGQALAEIQNMRAMAEAVGAEGTGLGQTMLKEFEALETRMGNMSQFGNDDESLMREAKAIYNMQLDIMHGVGKGPDRVQVDGEFNLKPLAPDDPRVAKDREADINKAIKRGTPETTPPAVEAKPDEEGYVPYAGGNKRIKRIKEITP